MPVNFDPASHIAVVNGPNLNLLGQREPEIYGNQSLQDIITMLDQMAQRHQVHLTHFQSNHEGAIIDKIQECIKSTAGIIINPGAYTHTSIAVRDAIAAYPHPVIEVHISNISNREAFRNESMISPVATGTICGLGIDGYRLALLWMIKHLGKS